MTSTDTARPDGHPDVKIGTLGALIVNLGTPDDVSYWPMRRYLNEFLSDRRIIEYPAWLWQPLLQTVILTVRPPKSAAAYRAIWREDADGSPLRHFTRRQGEALAARLADEGVMVDWAMRYGAPSIPDRLRALKEAGCDRILIVPLYPQYSATTSASVMDKAFATLQRMRWQPALRTAPPFHDHPAYIDALAVSVMEQLNGLDFEPDVVVCSFHGIPKSYFMKGDPYHCHCMKTARLLRERLGWSADRLRVTFQSRFGPTQWLEPSTNDTLKGLAADGVRRVAVLTPGFMADCVETLEEIGQEGRDVFLDAGGTNYAALACLNDSRAGVDVLETLVRQELAGWLAAPQRNAASPAARSAA